MLKQQKVVRSFFFSFYWICYNSASVSCFDFFGLEACGILAPWPGIKSLSPALEENLMPWTTSEVPIRSSFLVFINSKLSTSNLLSLFSVSQPCFSPELEWKPLNASLCLYPDDPLSLLPPFARVIFLSGKSYFVPLESSPRHTENLLRSVPIYFSNVSSLSLSSKNLVKFFNHAMIFTPHAFASA